MRFPFTTRQRKGQRALGPLMRGVDSSSLRKERGTLLISCSTLGIQFVEKRVKETLEYESNLESWLVDSDYKVVVPWELM